MSWARVLKCIGENRLYLFMLVFMLATEIFLAQSSSPEEKERELTEKKKIHKTLSREEMAAQEEKIRQVLSNNRFLAVTVTVSTLTAAAALMVGLVIGINCIARRLNGYNLMAAYGVPPQVCWQFSDILKVIITFYFLGYFLQWLEAGIAGLMKLKEPNKNLSAILNAALMDIVGLSIVLYFVINKFKGGLESLGVSLKNIKRDIKLALAGYLAILPVLAVIMMVVFIGVKVFTYEPPETKALELLYEARKPGLLFVLTLLVTLLGPVTEELFFRGFAYPVFRKKIGVRNAILLVSAIFALLHMNIVSFFPILALGILLAYLYEKTGSLIPSITVHVIHNTAVVFFVFLYKVIALPK